MAGMTISHLLGKIRDTIGTDATLAAWVQSNFSGSDLEVYLWVDSRDPPLKAQYPCVAIVKCMTRRAEDEPDTVFTVLIGVAVEQSGTTISGDSTRITRDGDTRVTRDGDTRITQGSEGNTTTYDGFELVEALAWGVADALFRGLKSALTLGTNEGNAVIEVDTESMDGDEGPYPLFVSYVVVRVRVVRDRRGALP